MTFDAESTARRPAMSRSRDGFPVSTVVVAMAMLALTAAAARAVPPQVAPTRKAGDETRAGDAKGNGKDKSGDQGIGKSGDPDRDKDHDKGKDKADESGPPACMRCGATCGLTPICVCEPGTKKKTRVEFESVREPVCIAGCGGHVQPTGCTDCCDEPCACPGRVRCCNRLRANTVTEEVPAVVRKVRYVCRCCESTCARPLPHTHHLPWTILAAWCRSLPLPWGPGSR